MNEHGWTFVRYWFNNLVYLSIGRKPWHFDMEGTPNNGGIHWWFEFRIRDYGLEIEYDTSSGLNFYSFNRKKAMETGKYWEK